MSKLSPDVHFYSDTPIRWTAHLCSNVGGVASVVRTSVFGWRTFPWPMPDL